MAIALTFVISMWAPARQGGYCFTCDLLTACRISLASLGVGTSSMFAITAIAIFLSGASTIAVLHPCWLPECLITF